MTASRRERNTWRWSRAIPIALVCAAACARARQTPDDTLVVVIEASLKDIDPRFAVSNHDTKLSRLVAPGLTSVDTADMEPRPLLAASLTRRDALTWDVVLRPGLRFSTGAPLTADDVVFTYESVLDPKGGSLQTKGFAERFEKVEATGPLAVRFHLKQPLATFESDLEFGIVSRAAAGPDGRYAGGRVVGAGPFAVERFSPDRLDLVRNRFFAGPPPKLARITVRVVRDANARALMLVGGSADFAQNAIRVDLVDQVASRPRVALASSPSAILTYLMMQNQDPILRDVRVRQAIACAIDRARIVRAKLGGRATLATGLLPPMHWAYDGEVDRWPYDPARARALLDAAGYPDPPGPTPRFHLTYKTSADQFRVALARVIAEELGEVGIDVEVRAFEFATFFADVKAGNFQLASQQTAEITEPDWLYTYFNSSRIPSPKDPGSHNRWRYHNARVDQLTELGRTTLDRAARKQIYGEVQAILARELPVVPLWHEDNVALTNRDVVGFQPLPDARLSGFATIEKR